MDRFSTTVPTDFSLAYFSTLNQFSAFLPRALGALIVLLLGALFARWIKQLFIQSFELLQISKTFKHTPVEEFLKHADLSSKIEQVLGTIVYWLFMLLVFHTTVSILGLSSLTTVLDRVLSYIPKIFSSIVVLFFGVLVAGVLESVVKGSIRSIEGKHARIIGKIASYLTLIIFILAAISELGIAQQFIIILFIGFVTTISISLSLAIGLGSREIVARLADEWYQNLRKDLSKE